MRWQKLTCGGIEAEEALAEQGLAAHMATKPHGRWIMPEPFVNFTAIWVPMRGNCLDDVPGVMTDF